MPTQINGRLVEILNREFERIKAQDGSDKYRNINEMAEFLGIQPSTLSHYRNAKRQLGRNAARQFANKFRSDDHGGNPSEREMLAEELFGARPPADEEEMQAQSWIKAIGAPEHLLLVEFRQLPSARPRGPNPGLAIDVGRAIASGLAYGLLVPFPERLGQSASVSGKIKAFVDLIRESVAETFENIFWEALSEAAHLARTKGKDVNEAFREVELRLRVYIQRLPDDAQIDPCPGLGFNLFWHHHDEKTEILQWLSTRECQKLLKVESSEVEIGAIESRFYPLPKFFEKFGRLPTTDEIEKFVKRDIGRRGQYPRWEVLDVLKKVDKEKMIEKILEPETDPI